MQMHFFHAVAYSGSWQGQERTLAVSLTGAATGQYHSLYSNALYTVNHKHSKKQIISVVYKLYNKHSKI